MTDGYTPIAGSTKGPVPLCDFCRKKPESFFVEYPAVLEDAFRKFDDTIIHVVQRFNQPVLHWFDQIMTFITCIEVGCFVPLFLFALGFDELAACILTLIVYTALVSQVPKRFLWRDRPYMQGRAVRRRKDETSSMPSRAVTCAVVYSLGGVLAAVETHPTLPVVAIAVPVLLLSVPFVLLTAAARVQLGVHFPSDCVFGVVQGLVIVVLSAVSFTSAAALCTVSHEDAAPFDVSTLPLLWIALLLGIGLLLAFVALAPPLRFWPKAPHILGLLLPAVIYAATVHCPTIGATPRDFVVEGGAGVGLRDLLTVVVWAGAVIVICIGGASLNHRKATVGGVVLGLVFYTIVSVALFIGLIVWRLFVMNTHW